MINKRYLKNIKDIYRKRGYKIIEVTEAPLPD